LSAGSTPRRDHGALTTFQKYYYQTIYDHAVAKNPENVITGRGYAGTPGGTELKPRFQKPPLLAGRLCGRFPGNRSPSGDSSIKNRHQRLWLPGVEVEAIPAQVPRKIRSSAYAQFGAMTPYGKRRFQRRPYQSCSWIGHGERSVFTRYFCHVIANLSAVYFSGIVDCHLNGEFADESRAIKLIYTHKRRRGDILWG